MNIPFTLEEVKTATRKLKNNKSPGNDEISIELLKYAPNIIYDEISQIYNIIAETGEYPKELIQGLLCPLQKPGKAKGPPENLRPIILLSALRKILAVCIMNRIGNRIDAEIPQTQAAYRSGRSTTEHVFSTNMVIERTISSKNEKIYLILLDMSKAFDSINRALLINDLQSVIDPDELHLIKILLNVQLAVKCGKAQSKYFETDIGAPQGDCASANEFTFYLAKSLTERNNTIQHIEHSYFSNHIKKQNIIISQEHTEHSYTIPTLVNHIDIDHEYADDISKITSNYSSIQYLKYHLPQQLQKRDLTINKTKTEEYIITQKKKCDNGWRSCKLLGSLLNTENDIKRGKGFAINVILKLY